MPGHPTGTHPHVHTRTGLLLAVIKHFLVTIFPYYNENYVSVFVSERLGCGTHRQQLPLTVACTDPTPLACLLLCQWVVNFAIGTWFVINIFFNYFSCIFTGPVCCASHIRLGCSCSCMRDGMPDLWCHV